MIPVITLIGLLLFSRLKSFYSTSIVVGSAAFIAAIIFGMPVTKVLVSKRVLFGRLKKSLANRLVLTRR